MTRSRVRGVLPLLLLALVVAALAFAALRGPDLYERFSHPLEHVQLISAAASVNHVDPYLIAAVINVESGFREDVVSSAGAVGLMQVLPSTGGAVAARIGVTGRVNTATLSNPDTNVRIGTAYLAELISRYDGSVDLALAAYNAGMTNADRWAIRWHREKGELSAVIDFPETAHYVDEVRAQLAVYRALYSEAFPGSRK